MSHALNLNLAPRVTPLLLAAAVVCVGCQRPAAKGARQVGPSVIQLRLPARLGSLQRPAVEYDHGLHVKQLGPGSCKTCHKHDSKGKLVPKFGRLSDRGSRDKLTALYHDQCMGCHKKRGVGPRGCGECHTKRPSTRSTRLTMSFDYALHYRHERQLGEQKSCKSCHHIYDKAQQRLIHEKGTESNCRDCHGARQKGSKPSLRNAVHGDCVSCHLKRTVAKQVTGPVRCAGCHGAMQRKKIQQHAKDIVVPRLKLAYSPRLKRRQPNKLWLRAPGTRAKLVAFDHQAHEPRARFCSSCHHETLAACKSCHSLQGKKKGGGVTLATAYHAKDAKQSCVGCHRAETAKTACAGCHRVASAEPSKRTCGVCHNGPLPGKTLAALPTTFPPMAKVGPLPATSKTDFPEYVLIKGLAKSYAPSKMPHGRIVAKLDKLIQKSKLAQQFHGQRRTVCVGCHHHAPAGARPAACSSCHGRTGHPTQDKPGLMTAYHRQCMGCHKTMGLARLNKCTSCHKAARSLRPGGAK